MLNRAQPTSPVIQTQQFELVDAAGAARGVPRTAPEGTGPEVALLDEAGASTGGDHQEQRKASTPPHRRSRTPSGLAGGTTKLDFVALNVRDGSGVIRPN